MIGFTRREATSDVLVVASLNNRPFDRYVIEIDPDRLPAGTWVETFNSDAGLYGGRDIGNSGQTISSEQGRVALRLPANGFIVLQRV